MKEHKITKENVKNVKLIGIISAILGVLLISFGVYLVSFTDYTFNIGSAFLLSISFHTYLFGGMAIYFREHFKEENKE